MRIIINWLIYGKLQHDAFEWENELKDEAEFWKLSELLKYIDNNPKIRYQRFAKLMSPKAEEEISNIHGQLQEAKKHAQLAKEHGFSHAESTKQFSELEKSLLSQQKQFEKTSGKNLLELLKIIY